MYYKPHCIALGSGYFGAHLTLDVFKKIKSVKIIDIDDEYEEGTLCWLETPLNPTGEST